MTDTPLEPGLLKPARVRTTRRTTRPYADAVLFMALHGLYVLYRRQNDLCPCWVMGYAAGAPGVEGVRPWADEFSMRDEILWKVTQHLQATSPRERMMLLTGRKLEQGGVWENTR